MTGTYAELEARGVKITRGAFAPSASAADLALGAMEEVRGVAEKLDGQWAARPLPKARPHKAAPSTAGYGSVITVLLPSATGLKVCFRHEGVGTKLKKLFKAEVKTGDPDWDRVVYVASSNDHALLTELLQSQVLRDEILLSIVGGGTIEVDGAVITWEAPAGASPEAAIVALTIFAMERALTAEMV